ncbi:hypothetical protein [Schaedlerella sp.]|uniref:hypothetical protein n=1 Tax=Schaedlerella sp. TaxID=2676057 RepID=UPI0037458EBB
MREVSGFYDGDIVQLLEPAPEKKQKVIVTFIEDENTYEDLPIGSLSRYADPKKRLIEKGAFERAMMEKHGNG